MIGGPFPGSPAELAAELREAREELTDAERVSAMVADVFTGDRGSARLSRRWAVEVLVAQRRVELWQDTVRRLTVQAGMIGLRP